MVKPLEFRGTVITTKDQFDEYYLKLPKLRDTETFIDTVTKWIYDCIAYLGDHHREDWDEDIYELFSYCFDEWDMRVDTYDTVHTNVDFYKGYYEGLFVYKVNDKFYGIPFSDNGDCLAIDLAETHPVYPREKTITVWEDSPDSMTGIRW